MFKYGDHVTLVQKARTGQDGATVLRRVHAIVLGSAMHKPLTASRDVVKGAAEEEHLDLIYANMDFAGALTKVRSPEVVMKVAHSVRAWVDGAWIGWLDTDAELRGQLAAIAEENSDTGLQLVKAREQVNELEAKLAADASKESEPDADAPAGAPEPAEAEPAANGNAGIAAES